MLYKKISNSIFVSLGALILISFYSCKKNHTSPVVSNIVTDKSGNIYHTVQIGDQIWTVENFRDTLYNDGTAITHITDLDKWGDITTGEYCYYNSTNNADTQRVYGPLYDWYTAHSGKIAPAGWHVPDSTDFNILINTLGGSNAAGGELKDTTTDPNKGMWLSSNTGGATNSSGFKAIPTGQFTFSGDFADIGKNAYFWVFTDDSTDPRFAYYQKLSYDTKIIDRYTGYKDLAISIRFVKNK